MSVAVLRYSLIGMFLWLTCTEDLIHYSGRNLVIYYLQQPNYRNLYQQFLAISSM